MDLKPLLLKQEIDAITARAREEMRGEEGEFSLNYLGLEVTVFCRKGTPKKMKIVSGKKTVYVEI